MIAVVSDLMFRSKIREGAGSVIFVKSKETLEAELLKGGHQTVVVDLNTKGVDPIQAITIAKNTPSIERIVAYGSHVEREALEKAREAGATEVMARSQFVGSLNTLESQRGASKLTLLVFGAMLFAALHYMYHVIPFYYDYYELENQMSAIIKIASTEKDTVIAKRLKQTIKELGIPADPDSLFLNRKDSTMEIQLQYREVYYITLRGKDYILQTFDFDAHVKENF